MPGVAYPDDQTTYAGAFKELVRMEEVPKHYLSERDHGGKLPGNTRHEQPPLETWKMFREGWAQTTR